MLSLDLIVERIEAHLHNPNSSSNLDFPSNFIRFAGGAGVLVPLIQRNHEFFVLLTKRSSQLRSHPGETAFPGGKADDGECVVSCAIREAYEEIGLTPECLTIIGRLDFIISRSNLMVGSVVALVDESKFKPKLNEREVESLFEVPLVLFRDLQADTTGSSYKPS